MLNKQILETYFVHLTIRISKTKVRSIDRQTVCFERSALVRSIRYRSYASYHIERSFVLSLGKPSVERAYIEYSALLADKQIKAYALNLS